MKTRGTGVRILLSISAAVVLAATAGCNATSVVAEQEAPQAVMVTNVPPPEPPASEVAVVAEAPPVQMSLRPMPALPEDVGKVVQLVESGAGEEVVQAFVGASQSRYDLSLDQIVYLRDVGVSDGVIASMMRRGAELREKDVEAAAMQTNLVAAVEQIKQGLAAGEAQAVEPAPQATGVDAGVPATEAAAAAVAIQAPQPPMEAPLPVQQFYTSLSPYGTWYQVPTYGWVWRPAVVTVDPGWMPYRHGGRWMWTDQGWYWNSEYSWGWAPFHYGRWTMYPSLGWCWTPDTVWGPSWVTWRHTGGYIGWAPLPPHCGWSSGVGLTWYGRGVSVGFGFGLATSHYTFVSGRRFGHRNISQHAVRGNEHDGAYRQSTVVNNVINGNNNVIINNGIGYNQVSSMTRDEIPKARVQPLPGASSTALRADRLERGRDGLVVYRPTSVESVGGRPVLRSEVRPAATSSSPNRSLGAVPGSRPTQNSRLTGSPGSSPAKSAGSRGGGATGANVPTASGARQVPTGRSAVVSSPQSNPARPTARPMVTTPSAR
ncbi:MAG: hypothetical protein Q7T30_00675, partial [Planctomycetota bacterium]|nr:hypothetical protein [Planctomycetota bacterium]